MNASDINALADYNKILQYYNFSEVHGEGEKIRACCKLHGGRKNTSFEVDTTRNLWYCHSGCKCGGNAITLIRQLEGCSFVDACHLVASISGFTIDGRITAKKSELDDSDKLQRWFDSLKPKTIHLPKYTPSYYPSSRISSYRGLTEDVMSVASYYHIYPLEDDKRLYNRICFPLVIEGQVVGVSLRSTKKDDPIKWIHLPRGFRKSHFLYGYDVAKQHMSENKITDLIVVEGILDVLKFRQNGIFNVVGILGSRITGGQVFLLMKIATKLILCFDADEAGYTALAKYSEELKSKFDIGFILLPDGKDPTECTDEEIVEAHKNIQNA